VAINGLKRKKELPILRAEIEKFDVAVQKKALNSYGLI